jgi:DNA replication initiation complex subunit (GINS family)
MISYNEIYEAARKERYSEQLQPIQKNFVAEFSKYIKEKKELVSAEGEFSDNVLKVKKQLENAMTLFKELIIRRRKKILNLVLIASETGISKQDFENMLSIEKDLFEDLMRVTEESDKKLNTLLSSGEDEQEQKNEMVLFLGDVGEFVGMDGNMLGPFEKGQIANLPKEVVKILIDGKKVELVEK